MVELRENDILNGVCPISTEILPQRIFTLSFFPSFYLFQLCLSSFPFSSHYCLLYKQADVHDSEGLQGPTTKHPTVPVYLNAIAIRVIENIKNCISSTYAILSMPVVLPLSSPDTLTNVVSLLP